MREILFRGKTACKVRGLSKSPIWVYGDRFNDPNGLCIVTGTGNFPLVIPETLGQFSGVLDSNGEKIFEGDIVRMSYTGKYLGVNGTAEVVFQNGKFGVIWGWHKEFVALDGFANTKIEIIGNVFDNSELLEEK